MGPLKIIPLIESCTQDGWEPLAIIYPDAQVFSSASRVISAYIPGGRNSHVRVFDKDKGAWRTPVMMTGMRFSNRRSMTQVISAGVICQAGPEGHKVLNLMIGSEVDLTKFTPTRKPNEVGFCLGHGGLVDHMWSLLGSLECKGWAPIRFYSEIVPHIEYRLGCTVEYLEPPFKGLLLVGLGVHVYVERLEAGAVIYHAEHHPDAWVWESIKPEKSL